MFEGNLFQNIDHISKDSKKRDDWNFLSSTQEEKERGTRRSN